MTVLSVNRKISIPEAREILDIFSTAYITREKNLTIIRVDRCPTKILQASVSRILNIEMDPNQSMIDRDETPLSEMIFGSSDNPFLHHPCKGGFKWQSDEKKLYANLLKVSSMSHRMGWKV